MKRRAFFAALAGLCAAPAVAALPKLTVPCETVVLDDLIPECGLDWRELLEQRRLEIEKYMLAEVQAATMSAMIVGVVETPLTHEEIRVLFDRDARLLGW